MNLAHIPIHVLLVEDTLMAVVAAQSLLKAAGCTVDVANTGAEAIEKLHNHYNIVILDLGLPDYEGLDVARVIRNHPGAISSVPIIALTAHANDNAHRVLAKKVGLNGFLSKPLSGALCEALVAELASTKPGKADFWHLSNR